MNNDEGVLVMIGIMKYPDSILVVVTDTPDFINLYYTVSKEDADALRNYICSTVEKTYAFLEGSSNYAESFRNTLVCNCTEQIALSAFELFDIEYTKVSREQLDIRNIACY
tara:strand:- start:1777 stop:2109 length:333 start_codon:yes stop_codon:yes gene_type:complete